MGTALTEATANFLVNRRMAKVQQMRWSRRGADLLLQVRCAALNGNSALVSVRFSKLTRSCVRSGYGCLIPHSVDGLLENQALDPVGSLQVPVERTKSPHASPLGARS